MGIITRGLVMGLYMKLIKELTDYPKSLFGYLVLIVLFQRGWAFYADISLDYQIVMAMVGAISWLICSITGLHRYHLQRTFFWLGSAFILVSFVVQEAYIEFSSIGSEYVVVTSSVVFSMGWVIVSYLWLEVFACYKPAVVLVAVSGASALSALCASLPQLVLGVSVVGLMSAGVLRIIFAMISLGCLFVQLQNLGISRISLSKNSTVASSCLATPSLPTALTREVFQAVFLVVLGVMAARFVQGLFFLEAFPYKEFGSLALLIASPLFSIVIIALVLRFQNHLGFVPQMYWLIVVCSLLALLVVVSTMDSSVNYLWLLLFTVYAQIDVSFFALMSSLPQFFGGRYVSMVAALFALKDASFVVGRVCQGYSSISSASSVSALLLLLVLSVLLVGYLYQNVSKGTNGQTIAPLSEVVSSSLGKKFDLTAREIDVLNALLQGRSYTNIGTKLFISKSTVKTHASHIYQKIGVRSRDELIEYIDSHYQ